MVPVMRGQADTCTARLAAVLDEASTAGSSAEPYWCGRLMNDLYPDRREAVRPHGGRCPARALSAHMARCSQHTPPAGRSVPPRSRSVPMTCSESAAAPARLDSKSEQFPTILSHLLAQLAGRDCQWALSNCSTRPHRDPRITNYILQYTHT